MKSKKIFIIIFICLFIFSTISYGSTILSVKIKDVFYDLTFSDYCTSSPYYAIIQSNSNMCYFSVVQCDIPFKIGYLKGQDSISTTGAFISGYEDNVVNDIGTQYNFKYCTGGTSSSEPSTSLRNWLANLSDSNFSVNSSSFRQGSDFLGTILYSNFDVQDYEGNIIHKSDADRFNITLSTTDTTNDPIFAYSNYFDLEDVYKYECYISEDGEEWDLMNYETFNDTINNVTKFRFNYKIFKNGQYHFKLLDKDTNKEKYVSIQITNILKNSSNSGYNQYGIPQPFCTYERAGDYFIIKTQNFTIEEMKKLDCLYCTDSNFSSDFTTWNKMSMGSFTNTQLNQTEYFFFFTVPRDSEDCIFYFIFYDNSQQKYGWPSSMNCNFAAMNEYCDSVSPVEKEKKSKFNELLDFFKDRFGFLVYPFEFIFNILNRFLNIPLKEPIFNIPDIYEPFSNTKIIKAQTFNLNSILTNNTFKTIHNYYLLFVDAFIIICIINLIKNKFKEVSQK